MVEYVVHASGWHTDACGNGKMYAAGERIMLDPSQAHWLVLSGQLKEAPPSKPAKKKTKTAEPAAD